MNGFPSAIRRFGEVAQEARAAGPPTRELAAIRRRALRTREVQVRERRERNVRLWLPLTPLFLLLAPFALLLAPLGYLAPPRFRPDPFRAAAALGAVLLSLGGTDIRVRSAGVNVHLKIL